MDAQPLLDPPIRRASTVLVIRDAAGGLEVLMVRRSRSASFMRDARVFPGGAVDDSDGLSEARAVVRWSGEPDELPWRAAALRELVEEAGIVIGGAAGLTLDPDRVYADAAEHGVTLDADRMVYVSNWVTPPGMPRRFDTRFYIVVADDAAEPVADAREVFDATFIAPSEAVARADAGEWLVELPTRVHLGFLEGFATARDAMAFAAALENVVKVEPQIEMGDDGRRVVLRQGREGAGA